MNAEKNSHPNHLDTAPGVCKRSWMTQQFGQPTGIIGRLVGKLMGLKNASMNRLAVELLEVQPNDRILEIGFGPGRAIGMLANRAQQGWVSGVDISEVMVRQAIKHNRKYVKTGRVEIQQARASSLPYEDESFTKICAVNSFHHWSNPSQCLKEAKRVLKDGGLLLLCLRMKHPKRTFMTAPGFTEEEIEQVLELVHHAGFQHPRTIRHRVGREVTCVLANR